MTVPAETPGQFRSCPNPVRLNVAIHEQLLAAVDGRRGVAAADCLCEACVILLDVDAAAISLVFDGASSGTLGSSGRPPAPTTNCSSPSARDRAWTSVAQRTPILVVDLADPEEVRWPAYGAAMLAHQSQRRLRGTRGRGRRICRRPRPLPRAARHIAGRGLGRCGRRRGTGSHPAIGSFRR